MIDFMADAVFFAVELALFSFGDVTAILGCIPLFLRANAAVLVLNLVGLLLIQTAVGQALVGAFLLIVQAFVHLVAAGVILVPVLLLLGVVGTGRNGSEADESDQANNESTDVFGIHMGFLSLRFSSQAELKSKPDAGSSGRKIQEFQMCRRGHLERNATELLHSLRRSAETVRNLSKSGFFLIF